MVDHRLDTVYVFTHCFRHFTLIPFCILILNYIIIIYKSEDLYYHSELMLKNRFDYLCKVLIHTNNRQSVIISMH